MIFPTAFLLIVLGLLITLTQGSPLLPSSIPFSRVDLTWSNAQADKVVGAILSGVPTVVGRI